MRDASVFKVLMKMRTFATAIGLDYKDTLGNEALNMMLKDIEYGFNIIFVFNQINPAKTAIIINETDIKMKTTRGSLARAPNICLY